MSELNRIVQSVVESTQEMLRKHLPGIEGRISYCAIFCRDEAEYDSLLRLLPPEALLAKSTATGPVYAVPPINTVAGPLRVLKIRNPDITRTERGDADHAVADYAGLKKRVAGKLGFELISRDEFEMIELMDSQFDARVYFSQPPVEEHIGVKEALERLEGGS